MSAQELLPKITTGGAEGGITAPPMSLPPMPATTSGAQVYETRMAATQALMQAGNGSLAGGGYRLKRKNTRRHGNNHISRVMIGCNNKKTKKHKHKRRRNNRRIFRGGAASNISPSVIGSKVEIPIPMGSSGGQIETLKSLSSGLLDAQVVGGNVAPSSPTLITSNFAGGGIRRSSIHRRKKTKYRILRHKKSIGRKGRSMRHR